MTNGAVILCGYDGLPEQSKEEAERLFKKIVEGERANPQYRLRFSPELSSYCRLGYRGLNYQRVLAIARSGAVIGKRPPTEKTREWRYMLRGTSAGKRYREKFVLIFSFESERSAALITCYPVTGKGPVK